MIARVLLFVLGLFVGACSTASHPVAPIKAPPAPASKALELRDKTVALVAINNEGDVRVRCSGVWVGPARILTAAHCLGDDGVGALEFYETPSDVYPSGSPIAEKVIVPRSAHVLAVDEEHDLALYDALHPPSHGIALPRFGSIDQGMPVQAMGNPLGLWFSYSTGVIAAVRDLEETGPSIVWIQTTAPVSPGSSGGGLFDDEGSLIGICHGSFTRGQSLNLFVHEKYINDLLAKNP